MDVTITAMSGDEDDLRSLREWLVMRTNCVAGSTWPRHHLGKVC